MLVHLSDKVETYSILNLDKGLSDCDILLKIDEGTGNQVMRISQVALVDPATSLLYLLVVRCSAACYKANQTAIDQIISSFTVRAH